MKKILFSVIMIMVLSTIAFANEEVDVLINPEISINYDIQSYNFYDAIGNNVFPITYNDSTYLPVRALSSLFKKGITWQGDTKTILLGQGDIDTQAARYENGIHQAAYTERAIKSDEISIIYNGEKQTFKDANGVVVYPIIFNGTTYLPVRALSNLFEASITWVGESKSIYIYSKEFYESPDDSFDDNLKENRGFAKEAKTSTTAYQGEVHKINSLYGISYYRLIDTHYGQKAQEIIDSVPSSMSNAHEVSKIAKDDEMILVAEFQVDTQENVSLLGDGLIYLDLMPSLKTKVSGSVDGNLVSLTIDGNNTVYGGVFLADSISYEIGDIAKLYYVFPVPKSMDILGIYYDFLDFETMQYKRFFQSFLGKSIKIEEPVKNEAEKTANISGIFENSKGETLKIVSVSDKTLLGGINYFYYDEEDKTQELRNVLYAEQSLRCALSEYDVEKLIESNAKISNIEFTNKGADFYVGMYESFPGYEEFYIIDAYKNNGEKLVSQERGAAFDFIKNNSSYTIKEYISDYLWPYGIFSFNEENNKGTFKVFRLNSSEMAFVISDCDLLESDYYSPGGTGFYPTAVSVDLADYTSEYAIIFSLYGGIRTYSNDDSYGILKLEPLKDEYGRAIKEVKEIYMERKEWTDSEVESEFLNAIKQIEENNDSIFLHHSYES